MMEKGALERLLFNLSRMKEETTSPYYKEVLIYFIAQVKEEIESVEQNSTEKKRNRTK